MLSQRSGSCHDQHYVTILWFSMITQGKTEDRIESNGHVERPLSWYRVLDAKSLSHVNLVTYVCFHDMNEEVFLLRHLRWFEFPEVHLENILGSITVIDLVHVFIELKSIQIVIKFDIVSVVIVFKLWRDDNAFVYVYSEETNILILTMWFINSWYRDPSARHIFVNIFEIPDSFVRMTDRRLRLQTSHFDFFWISCMDDTCVRVVSNESRSFDVSSCSLLDIKNHINLTWWYRKINDLLFLMILFQRPWRSITSGLLLSLSASEVYCMINRTFAYIFTNLPILIRERTDEIGQLRRFISIDRVTCECTLVFSSLRRWGVVSFELCAFLPRILW